MGHEQMDATAILDYFETIQISIKNNQEFTKLNKLYITI